VNNLGIILSVFRSRNRPYEERYVCGEKRVKGMLERVHCNNY
jgi:hypothetical protein